MGSVVVLKGGGRSSIPFGTRNADVMDGPHPATTPRPPDASFPCAHIPVSGSRP